MPYGIPGSPTYSEIFSSFDSMMVNLKDNTNREINARSLRDSVYTLWDKIDNIDIISNGSIGVTGSTGPSGVTGPMGPTGSSGATFVSITRTEAINMMDSSGLSIGCLYEISECYSETKGSPYFLSMPCLCDTVYLTAKSSRDFYNEGYGIFSNPKYDKLSENFGIYDPYIYLSEPINFYSNIIDISSNNISVSNSDNGTAYILSPYLLKAEHGYWNIGTSSISCGTYSQIISISSVPLYQQGSQSIYGSFLWTYSGVNMPNSSSNFEFGGDWTKVNYSNNSSYNIVIDKIWYDIRFGVVYGREDKSFNKVIFSTQSLTDESINIDGSYPGYGLNGGDNNPVRDFQWGNDYDIDLGVGHKNNEIIDSYVNNKNGFSTFVNNKIYGSYMKNCFFNKNSYVMSNDISMSSGLYNVTLYNGDIIGNTIKNRSIIFNSSITSLNNSQSYGSYVNGNSSYDGVGTSLLNNQINVTSLLSNIFEMNTNLVIDIVDSSFNFNRLSNLSSELFYIKGSSFYLNDIKGSSFLLNVENSQFENNIISDSSFGLTMSDSYFNFNKIGSCESIDIVSLGSNFVNNILNVSSIGIGLSSSSSSFRNDIKNTTISSLTFSSASMYENIISSSSINNYNLISSEFNNNNFNKISLTRMNLNSSYFNLNKSTNVNISDATFIESYFRYNEIQNCILSYLYMTQSYSLVNNYLFNSTIRGITGTDGSFENNNVDDSSIDEITMLGCNFRHNTLFSFSVISNCLLDSTSFINNNFQQNSYFINNKLYQSSFNLNNFSNASYLSRLYATQSSILANSFTEVSGAQYATFSNALFSYNKFQLGSTTYFLTHSSTVNVVKNIFQ